MMRIALALAITFVLAACSAGGPFVQRCPAINPEKLVENKLPKRPDDTKPPLCPDYSGRPLPVTPDALKRSYLTQRIAYEQCRSLTRIWDRAWRRCPRD